MKLDFPFLSIAFAHQTNPALRTSSPGFKGILFQFFSDQEPGTIEAKRRRRDKNGPSGQAEMPGRPSSSSGNGGGIPPTSGGSASGGFPGGKKGGLSIGGILILIILYVIYSALCGGGGLFDATESTQNQEPFSNPSDLNNQQPSIPNNSTEQVSASPSIPLPTRTPRTYKPTLPSKGAAQTWTVMLYQDADDSILEQDIFMDFNEAESVGSNSQVNIVSQIDRFKGGYQGDGDWTNTRRYYLTQDHDLFHIHSKMVADLGETSMADPQTLVDFVTWAIKTYPADKYVLILSDHGMGWPGGMTDPSPAASRQVDLPFAQMVDTNMMYTREFDQALDKIVKQSGIDRFELIGMDACLMSNIEVYSALEPYTRYVVNSQETEPALGWAYSSFLQSLENDPGMDGAHLGKEIVSSFIKEDKRIVDSQARLDFLRQGSPMNSMFSGVQDMDPAQLSRQIEKSITLTAADMDKFPALMDSLNQFAYALQKENPSIIARSRTYAQSYTSIFGANAPPSYIDLGNFAQLIQQQSSSNTVRSAAQAVIDQIQQMVVAEKHGSEKPGSNGISIYFPNSQLYRNSISGARSYTQTINRFAKESLWDDFLAYHYTQSSFQIGSTNAAVPASNARVVIPGQGQIEVSPLQLSKTLVSIDQTVTMESTIKGSNIGYVYLFVGYLDSNSGSILVADKDFLESPETRQLGNFYYPNWGENQSFKLKYTWKPTVFTIGDGKTSTVALLEPVQYGASAEEAVYTTDGYYINSTSGEIRYARLFFSNGKLQRVYGFTGKEPTGALSEIIPKSGDQFTLIQTWLEPEGSGSYRQVTEKGKTLTFGSLSLVWKEMVAGIGEYILGYIVSDLEGNEKQVFGKISIK